MTNRTDLDRSGTDGETVALQPQPALADSAASQDKTTPANRRGRPKLGVVAREVTLLPRHWEWLNAQPGGASLALRKLIDEATALDDRAG